MKTPFAYALLTWIRENKSWLYTLTAQVSDIDSASRPAPSSSSNGHLIGVVAYEQHIERVRAGLARYERRYRGAQQWLRTLAAPDCPPWFLSQATLAATHLAREIWQVKPWQFDTRWRGFTGLVGLAKYDFHRMLSLHVWCARLPDFMKAVKGSPRAEWEMGSAKLTLTFYNGTVSRTQAATLPYPEPEQSIGGQLKQMAAFWRGMREHIVAQLADPKSTPSDEDVRQDEERRARAIAQRLAAQLDAQTLELLSRHRDTFVRVLLKTP